MKFLISFIFLLSLSFGITANDHLPSAKKSFTKDNTDDQFLKEARDIANALKSSLVSELTAKIAKDGPVEAIPFCHENVKLIAKKALNSNISRFEFGRTSHKLRNLSNTPQNWMIQYVENFKGKKKNEISSDYIIHHFKNSKRAYLEPLYVGAKCLVCHGENVSEKIKSKINVFYPKDEAVNFKLNEFRGFIWVKEK